MDKITTNARELRNGNLQMIIATAALKDLAEQCALTYQTIRNELSMRENRQKKMEGATPNNHANVQKEASTSGEHLLLRSLRRELY